MVYGYIRVSTDKQTVENQRFEIENFCKNEKMEINGWIDETISGTFVYDKRKLGTLLKKVKKGDIIICSEISRLGRNLFMIMEILNKCMKKGCQVWTIKDNYRLGNDIQSKVLAFAFGLSAEIERNLISQRTKEALKRKRAEGVILGRPVGRLSCVLKLSGKEEKIKEKLLMGLPFTKIAEDLKVDRNTLSLFIHRKSMLKELLKDRKHVNSSACMRNIDTIKDMLEKGISREEIAKEINVAYSSLSGFINRWHLGKNREIIVQEKKEKIKSMLLQGIPRNEIAEEMKMSVRHLSTFITRHRINKEIIENE